MPPLKNQQHELFCLALMSGMSQAAAARKAGYTPSCARSTASEILTYPDIIKRRAELSRLTTSETTMSVEKRKERLSEIANEPVKQPVTAKEVIMSVSELNKMDGIYELGGKVIYANVTQVIINSNGEGEAKPFRELVSGLPEGGEKNPD